MCERYIFPRFFFALAIGGAVAEWALGWWLVAPLCLTATVRVHVAGLAILALVNWLPARRLERHPAPGLVAARTGHVILGVAFAALVAGCALLGTAGLWATMRFAGALQVEAAVVKAGGGEAFFGHTFQLLGTAVVALTGAAIGYGYTVGHRRLELTALTVPLPGAPSGLRVVQVSDLHLGPLADRRALREALARIVALDPDVVCVTGDIVDSPATDLDDWVPELAALRARHGVFAILGNHDRHAGTDRVVDALARWTSWRVLRDQTAVVEVGGSRLHVVGVEHARGATLPALLATVPADEAAIVLAHHPEVFLTAVTCGAPLMLAGHTHGGQIALPGLPHLNAARFGISRFDRGTFRIDGSVLHVSRGLGTSGQRVRIGARPEITVLTLVAEAC